ncbi:MAG: hypothetical protein ACRD0N_15075 [Acidimicrobiales bacterium]
MHEIREVLRLWLRGEGERSIARLAAVDRKTVRRHVEAATTAGLDRGAGEEALGDELISAVCEAVRPHRPDGHGSAWAVAAVHHNQLKAWLVDQGLTVVKAHELLERQGVELPPAHPAPLRLGGARRRPLGPQDDRAGGRWRTGVRGPMTLSA